MNKKAWMTWAVLFTLVAPVAYASDDTTTAITRALEDAAQTIKSEPVPPKDTSPKASTKVTNPIEAEVASVASFIEGAHKVDPSAPASLANVGKTYTMNSVAPMDIGEFENSTFLGEVTKAMAKPAEDPLLKDIATAKIDSTKPLIVLGSQGKQKDVAEVSPKEQALDTGKPDAPKTSADGDKDKPINPIKQVNSTVETWSARGIGASFYRGTDLKDTALNREGLVYRYDENRGEDLNLLVATHRDGGNFKTSRDIGIGNTRSELVFEYGSPLAMWRDNSNGNLIWLYEAHRTIKSPKSSKNIPEKKGISEGMENTYNSSSSQLRDPSVTYVLFTLKDSKIVTIDTIDSQVWPNLRIPAAQMIHFTAGTMRDEDFSLGGYRLNDSFTNDPNRSWKERGTLYGDDFIGYTDTAIAYDKDHQITKVLLNSSAGVTRRGVSIGDSKYLLLYVYGLPDFEEKGPSTNTIVYGYAHPSLPYTYLLFTVGKEGFIKSVMLSNQKMTNLLQR